MTLLSSHQRSSNRPLRPRAQRPRRSRRGNAYVLALLVLVLLATLGFSTVAVTQTEVIAGSYDLVSQRVHYAAESGVHIAAARALVSNDRQAGTYLMDDTPERSATPMRNRIEVSPFVPLVDTPCNLCEINQAGTYNEKAFRAINHVVNSTAQRVGPGGVVTQQRTLSVMLEFQPWKSSVDQSAIVDPGDLQSIRY